MNIMLLIRILSSNFRDLPSGKAMFFFKSSPGVLDRSVNFNIAKISIKTARVSRLSVSCDYDETHLDAVRGLSDQEVFTPVHQQVELVGAMRLRPIRQTDLLHANAKDLIQS